MYIILNCTHWGLDKHSSLVSHCPHNLQRIDGLQDLHLAQCCLHQHENSRSTNSSTECIRYTYTDRIFANAKFCTKVYLQCAAIGPSMLSLNFFTACTNLRKSTLLPGIPANVKQKVRHLALFQNNHTWNGGYVIWNNNPQNMWHHMEILENLGSETTTLHSYSHFTSIETNET